MLLSKKKYRLKESEKTSQNDVEELFLEIYSLYSQKIYLYCRKIINDVSAAEDLYQEVFIKFYNALKEKKNIENPFGYILRIARNYCLNYNRDNQRVYHPIDDNNYSYYENTIESKELANLITASLELLPSEHKEAFILQVYNGMTYKEISELTLVPVTTVRNRVVRAKKKLREILQPYQEYKR